MTDRGTSRRLAQRRPARRNRPAAQPPACSRSRRFGSRRQSSQPCSPVSGLRCSSGTVRSGATRSRNRMLPSQPSSAARPAPAAIRRRRSCGARRSTSTRWTTPPTSRCSATSPMRRSTITACARAFSARTASSSSRPTGRTASSPRSRSSTRSASIRCSNISSSFPTAACRRCRSPGTAGRRTSGGQRWFHLYPDEEIKHGDILHWTKLNQNWNFMCAECHSTGVRKNYDAASDRFATSLAEISVGCEACHGQGSRHVAWAQRAGRAGGRSARTRTRRWGCSSALRRAARHHLADQSRRPATPCAASRRPRCARRSRPAACATPAAAHFSEDWVPGRPLSDTHAVSPLARGLYHADGQMRDEVYNYGSFKQSKMFAAGVTCSDCHEPHGAKLRAPGDGACLQCHAADKYAAGEPSPP